MSIRKQYEDLGVRGFYESEIPYVNDHSIYVERLLRDNHESLPLENVLDLGCGGGIVTTTLQSLGYQGIEGIDAYLSFHYEAMTGRPCRRLSFTNLVTGKVHGRPIEHRKYSCIISSFALHLCEKSMLPALMWRLSEMTSRLVVISPSKFPLIGKPKVEKFALTPDKKRVHYREYSLTI